MTYEGQESSVGFANNGGAQAERAGRADAVGESSAVAFRAHRSRGGQRRKSQRQGDITEHFGDG